MEVERKGYPSLLLPLTKTNVREPTSIADLQPRSGVGTRILRESNSDLREPANASIEPSRLLPIRLVQGGIIAVLAS